MVDDMFKYGSVLKVTRYDTDQDIEKNLSLMKECGMDTVVLWPAAFWWEEKKEGYPFNTGKRILDIASKHDMKIIMEIAGQLTVFEYIPDFLMKKEYHPKTLNGAREVGQSGFGFLSYFHPEVNTLICEHFKSAANAYKDHPALLGYDVFNETMFRSYDEYTIKEFQVWLEEKYQTIDRLNEVWERTYSDWSQIDYESWKWMSIMSEVDFAMFRKASIARFLKKWCAAIREVDDTHFLIADNVHSTVSPKCSYERPQDDFELKETVDEIGMSFYPKQIKSTMEHALRWEIFDAFYTASKREGFYISEMQTHIQSLYNYTTCVRPHELKRWCLEAYAGGAKSLIYWMWRPFDKGLQTLGRGLVDYKGRPTERFDMAKQLSGIFRKYDVIHPLRAKIGILFDKICDDYQRGITKNYSVDDNLYLSSIYGAYKAIFDCGERADIITIDELCDYQVVFVSNHLVMNAERASLLKDYVRNGGIIIIDGRFGILDETSKVQGQLPGGEACELCGTEYMDSDYEGLTFIYNGKTINGFFGRELVEDTTADVLARFEDGYPAVTRVQYGEGEALTFNSCPWYGYSKTEDATIKTLMFELLKKFDLIQNTSKGQLKVRISETKDKYLAFVFNYSDAEITESISYIIDGKEYRFEAKVDGNDSIIIELER